MVYLLILLGISIFYLLMASPKKAVTFKNDQMVIRTSKFSTGKFSKHEIKDLYIFEEGLPKHTVVMNGSWYSGNATTLVPAINRNRMIFSTTSGGKFLVNVDNADDLIQKYMEWKQAN